MKLDRLIWARVTVETKTGKPLNEMSNVIAHTANHLIHFRQCTSAQGITNGKALCFSFPELVAMSQTCIILKAFTWGETPKDDEVVIKLEF